MSEVERHCTHFYIRANRCESLYASIFALRGWKEVEVNGIAYEVNSILVEKWKGKAHRLVIQRQRRVDGETDLWEGEYTYRCILTNDFGTPAMDIVEFYNLRGGKERILDDMGNGFGWGRRRIRSAPYGPMTAYCLKTHRGVRGFCATETPKYHSLRPEGIFPACYFGTLYSCRSVADLRKESIYISINQ